MTAAGREPTAIGPPGATGGRTDVLHRLAGWVRTHPGLVVLLVAPLVVLTVPLFSGRVFLDGDNFLQNFPLRVLVGRYLQHGALPLWNPYLFSGTPLLGGFNAGAAYPTNWLMAVLPPVTAWTINLALVYDVAVAGMYVFLRRQPVDSTAATFGAATFAFAGYMTAQIVHIDIVQGAAWLPWMLVAVHELTDGAAGRLDETVDPRASEPDPVGERARARRRARGWTALLAVAVGMSLLTGGAESAVDSGVLVAIYWIGRLVTSGRFRRDERGRLVRSTLSILCGVALGFLLGSAQSIPGLAFQAHSQRAGSSYSFFASGSLPGRLVTLVASPFLLGTNRNQPGFYAGPYNLQEVTSYVGVLALIAGCSLLVRRWRRRPEARSWWVWYVVLIVGLLSALGTETPFGHVLFLLPVINTERLLNRNLLMVDFSLAVLLAWWVHLLLADRPHGSAQLRSAQPRSTPAPDAPDAPARRWWAPGRRAELIATCTPLAFITVVCVIFWADGARLQRFLGIQFTVDGATRYKTAGLATVGALIAAAATLVVLSERRLSAPMLRRLLAGVLATDLIMFNLFTIATPTTQTLALAQGATAARFATLVGDARFLIYDPDELDDPQLYALGQTDLNVLNQVHSGQGYTALTDGGYYAATGAHYQEDLAPASLAGTVWDDLNARTLLSLPSYFMTPVQPATANASSGTARSVPFPTTPNIYNGAPAARTGPVTIAPGQSHRWYFGGALTLDSAAFGVPHGNIGGVTVGMVTATGAVEWLGASGSPVVHRGPSRSVQVSFGTPVRAGGLIVRNDGTTPTVIDIPTARTAETGAVMLNGVLQYGVHWPHWKFTGTFGVFGVFENTATRGWAWAGAPGGGAPPPGAEVTAGPPGTNGRQQVVVHAPSALVLERSVSWTTGWQATAQPIEPPSGTGVAGHALGPARATTVYQNGVVQQVALPSPGYYLVTFTYSPNVARAGIALSALAASALVLWGAWELLGSRRRRDQPGARRPMASAARR